MSDKQMSTSQHCWLAEDDNRYTLYRTISQNTFWDDLFDIIQGYLFKFTGRFSLKLKQQIWSFNLSIHFTCIKSWFEQNNQCPECRSDARPDAY